MAEKSKKESRTKGDLLSTVIGICEGPADLAEEHDKYAYEYIHYEQAGLGFKIMPKW
jgi:hypothetical protein